MLVVQPVMLKLLLVFLHGFPIDHGFLRSFRNTGTGSIESHFRFRARRSFTFPPHPDRLASYQKSKSEYFDRSVLTLDRRETSLRTIASRTELKLAVGRSDRLNVGTKSVEQSSWSGAMIDSKLTVMRKICTRDVHEWDANECKEIRKV